MKNFEWLKKILIVCSPLFLIFFIFGLIDWLSSIADLSKEDNSIINFGYLGGFLGGTLGTLFTAGSLFYLAKTLDFERKKSDQENFDNKFFLLLERLESIKDKINEDTKDKILNKIDAISKFSIRETLEESKKIIHKYNSEIGHYYRMLYQILKMINKSKEKIQGFDIVKQKYYTNILRATLDYKLTQILAINTYCSKEFDSEYEDYTKYVREYDFFEHMPFCIIENRISESLLAVYLNCDKGFGNSSFVKRLNNYVLDSLVRSIKSGYSFDLNYLYLKRLAGRWIGENNKFEINIDLKNKKIIIVFNHEKIFIELVEEFNGRFIKCILFNDTYYDVSSYFDDELNFIINYNDDITAFKQSGFCLDEMKDIVFVLNTLSLNDLKVEVLSEYQCNSDYDCFNEKLIKLNDL